MSGNPFDPNYRSQLGKLHHNQTAERSMKQSLRRTREGNSFDRNPIRLTTTDADMAKAALIKTPSAYRQKGGR